MRGAGLCLVVLGVVSLGIERPGSASEAASPGRDTRTLHAVLDRIAGNYVEPSRVDPRRMLWGAARSLDRDVPEVLLESDEGTASLVLRVSGERRTFSAADVRSLPALERTLREILRFVASRRSSSSMPNAEYVAIKGMLATLDPHSLLLDPAEAREMATQIASRLFGIGVTFDNSGSRATGADPGVPVVTSVMKGGPADWAGIAVCDRILAVEDRWAAGLDWRDLAGLIRGPGGSPVWLTLLHDGAIRDVVVTRGEVKLPTVDSRLLEGDVGLIRIFGFARGTAAEVRSALESQKAGGARAWILDLRTDMGGLLSEAVETASIFVRSGPIVTTLEGAGHRRETSEARRTLPGPLEEGPLAVLIGPGTVSAAEVLTGALQNRNRAAILGRTSFGKGSVQFLYDEEDGSKLTLTVAHYVTPGGVSLQSRGVTPDVELVPVPVPSPGRIRLSGEDAAGREADLDRAFAARGAPQASEISLKYLAATPDGEEEVRIARDLLVGARAESRGASLARADSMLRRLRDAEETKISAALTEAGVDWSAGPPRASARLSVRCRQSGPAAGDHVPVECEAKNEGPDDAFRVFGRTRPPAFDLKDEEIVVGRVPAGSTRKLTLDGRLAEDPSPRVSWVTFSFSDQSEGGARNVPLRIETGARVRPVPGGAPRQLEIRVEAGPLETTEDERTVRVSIRASDVRDAWVRISNEGAKLDRKKVAYVARSADAAGAAFDLAADVPLKDGLNEIAVCSRAGSQERCESTFVYRLVR